MTNVVLGLCKRIIPNESKCKYCKSIPSSPFLILVHSLSLALCFISASISISILPLYLIQQNATNKSHKTIGYAILTPRIFLVHMRGGKGQA